jgi:hypothetical protein
MATAEQWEPDDARVSRPDACPVKASVFSRRQTCRDKSQAAEWRQTKTLKPIDEVSRCRNWCGCCLHARRAQCRLAHLVLMAVSQCRALRTIETGTFRPTMAFTVPRIIVGPSRSPDGSGAKSFPKRVICRRTRPPRDVLHTSFKGGGVSPAILSVSAASSVACLTAVSSRFFSSSTRWTRRP